MLEFLLNDYPSSRLVGIVLDMARRQNINSFRHFVSVYKGIISCVKVADFMILFSKASPFCLLPSYYILIDQIPTDWNLFKVLSIAPWPCDFHTLSFYASITIITLAPSTGTSFTDGWIMTPMLQLGNERTFVHFTSHSGLLSFSAILCLTSNVATSALPTEPSPDQ